jgi:drug/metabolite transporter (DMT)-like permease
MSGPFLLLLCATSAGFYVAATAVMKLAGNVPFLLVLLPVYAALGLAAWFESTALTTNRFGLVGLLILASEVVLTAGVAIALGERYSLREVAGLALIVAGVAVVFAADGAEPAPRSAATPPVAAAA